MTNDDLIDAWKIHPAVYQAHHTTDPASGVSKPPTPAALESSCNVALQTTIGYLLTWDTILRALGKKKTTITLSGSQWDSSTYTYTFSNSENVGEVLDVAIGTGKKPLRKFVDEADYIRWYYDYVASDNNDTSSVSYAYGFYVFFQNTTGQWKITFVPGAGDAESADVWHVERWNAPFQASAFPDSLHNLIYLAGLDLLVNGSFTQATLGVIGRLSKRLKPVKGGYSRGRHDPFIVAGVVSRNAQYTPLF